MAETRITFGATFSYGSPLTPVGHISNILLGGFTREISEIRYHDSGGLDFPTVIKGGNKCDDITVEIGFDANDSAHTNLIDLQKSGDNVAVSIGIPDTSPAVSWTGTVCIKSFTFGALDAASNIQRATIVMAVSGDMTLG